MSDHRIVSLTKLVALVSLVLAHIPSLNLVFPFERPLVEEDHALSGLGEAH
jgi:hypothetical protein